MSTPHIPTLRFGQPYRSLDVAAITDIRTGDALAELSIVNAGVIRRDRRRIEQAYKSLQSFSCTQLIDICARAADLFLNGDLPLGVDGDVQSAADYIRSISASSGLPQVMAKRNMAKIHHVLSNMAGVIAGLTRGLDLRALDAGYGEHNGAAVSFFPTTHALGAVLPSNSPGVHSLWLPALALKIPLLLKPGSAEPWTPWRLIVAMIEAGAPREVFGFYPTTHEGAQTVLETVDRSLIFGDQKTVDRCAADPRVQAHGPGHSKIILAADDWPNYLDVMVRSVLDNGGRSCINASCIVTPAHGRAIAEALAKHLASVEPTALEDESAQLAAFTNPDVAHAVNEQIEQRLQTPGVEEMTAHYRNGPRLVEHSQAVFLRPTVVLCDSWDHPLANTEYMFPFVSVVQTPQVEILDRIGPTLAAAVITKDQAFIRQCLSCASIQRLNLGAVPTSVVQWDQPHEGNLFELLYRRRAIQHAELAS